MQLKDNQYVLYKEKVRGRIGWYYRLMSNEFNGASIGLVHLLLRTNIPVQDSVEVLSDPLYRKKVVKKGIGGRKVVYKIKGVEMKILKEAQEIIKLKNKNCKINIFSS